MGDLIPDNRGKLLPGQQWDIAKNLGIPYTEQVMSAAEAALLVGTQFTEITPIDGNSCQVRTYDAAAAQDALEGFFSAAFTTISIESLNLPAELTALTVTYNQSNGDSADSDIGDGASIGTSPSLSLSPSSAGQSTASIIPDLQPTIVTRSGQIDAQDCVFYLPNNFTKADLLTKVGDALGGTCLSMPSFRPKSLTFTLKGEQVSVSSKSRATQSISLGDDDTEIYSIGTGYSRDNSLTNVTKEIPPTIHGAITISSTSASLDANATSHALITGASNWPERESGPLAVSQTAHGSVTPTSVTATDPALIPTSGLYATKNESSDFIFGWSEVHCLVIDAANL